jgi:hypothetical protein
MSWNHPRRVIIPWMETLARMLSQVALPHFQGRSVWVLSDYSFDNPASDFDVVGLLFVDPETLGDWLALRSKVRETFLRDQRSMSWKKLNSDSRRQAAFLPFLRAANQIYGLAIALAFHRVPAFAIPPDELRRCLDSFQLSTDCKPRLFQQMFRIASCTAMLVAGLSRPGQDIHWVSDEDAVFANEPIEKDTISLFTMLLRKFVPHQLTGSSSIWNNIARCRTVVARRPGSCARFDVRSNLRTNHFNQERICRHSPNLFKASPTYGPAPSIPRMVRDRSLAIEAVHLHFRGAKWATTHIRDTAPEPIGSLICTGQCVSDDSRIVTTPFYGYQVARVKRLPCRAKYTRQSGR